jgi:inorganic pyrophosphatase
MKSAWEQLPAIDDDGNVLAVIEAASESRCKFKFEPSLGAFQLHSVLPAGTAFPHSFGFIPGTLGEDGDPLDVVVMTDEPPPVSTIVPCRVIAILEAEQDEKGKTIRNDRLLAVAVSSERYAQCRHRKDVQETVLQRIADFFAFYHREQGKTFAPKGWKGAKTALQMLDAGRRAARRGHA